MVEDVEHGRAESSDRVVTVDGREGSVTASEHLLVSRSDIGERVRRGVVRGVEEGVDPSHGREVRGAAMIVQDGDHGGESGGSSAGSADGHALTSAEDLELSRDGGEVREGATGRVVERSQSANGGDGEVGLDDGVLEGGAGEIVRETS